MFSAVTISVFLIFINSNCINADANLRTAFLPFGNLTNQFLSTVQPNYDMIMAKVYLSTIKDKTNPISQISLDKYWRTYLGYLILFVLGLLFVIIFTLVGLCLCCCRCCCKRCGAKPADPLDRHKKRKRIIFNIFLFLLTTLIFIGAIVSMSSNVILSDALKPSNDSSDKAGNILAGIDKTITQIETFVNNIVDNFLTDGINVVNNSTENFLTILYKSISSYTKTFLDKVNLNSVVDSTDAVINGYITLKTQANNLSFISQLHFNKSNTFIDYLKSVSLNLAELLNNTACNNYTTYCDQIRNILPSLTIGYTLNNINYSLDGSIGSIVSQGNITEFTNAKASMVDKIDNITSLINSTISAQIKDFSNSINISSMINQFFNTTFDAKNLVRDNLNKIRNTIFHFKIGSSSVESGVLYSYYRYAFYGFCVLIGIILFVVLLFYVGLCFGVCGSKNFENSSYCNNSVGSRFLMGGVAISFIVGWLLMLIAMIMFAVGGVIQTEGCRYLTVTNTKAVATADEIIKTTIAKYNFSYSFKNVSIRLPDVDYVQSILIRCPASTDLISSFQIPTDYVNSLSDNIFKQFIVPKLESVVEQLSKYNIPTINVDPLKSKANDLFRVLTPLNESDSTPTIAELKKPVTNVSDFESFLQMIQNLSIISNQSSPKFSSNLSSIVDQLKGTVLDLTSVHNLYLQLKTSFVPTINHFQSLLQSLTTMIGNLSTKINEAHIAAVSLANYTIWQNTGDLFNQTVFNVIKSVGNCQGFATAFKSAVGIVCTTFLVPFNNIWMGIGWFLLFIIPTIIFALKLHQLYRMSHVSDQSSQLIKGSGRSNHSLSQRDLELIRMDRPHRI